MFSRPFCNCLHEPMVTGRDLKDYRHTLHMSVGTYAGFIGKPRQLIAATERLNRPLTRDEILSTMPVSTKLRFSKIPVQIS